MENTNFEQRLIYQQAKSELLGRLRTMGIIALFWFLLLRICLLGTEDVTNWDLIQDSITAATAMYLPYRVAYMLTGTPAGGTVGAIAIMIWMSTWVSKHELLAWVLIIGGYLIDFGPWIIKLVTSKVRKFVF